MPDPHDHSKVKGIHLHGIKNAWLDAVQQQKDRDRELERDSEAFEDLFDAPEHRKLKHPHHQP